MLLSRVTLVSDSGVELQLDADRPSASSGWGLAPASEGTMEGWWAPPSPRAEAVVRPQADGAFAPHDLLVGARVLTLVAHHVSSSAVEERQARETMAALARGWLRIVVEEAGHVSHVRGFVAEPVEVKHRAGYRSTWQLVVSCPDPLKYGGPGSDDVDLSAWEVSTGIWSLAGDGGALFPLFDQFPTDDVLSTSSPTLRFTGGVSSSLEVTNDGSAPTWPVLEVAGPVSWAQWTLSEQVVRWEEPVPSGMVLRINAQDGSCEIGGVRVTQAGLSRDHFFPLPPGRSTIAVEADRVARFQVRWLSAWI